MPSEHEHYSKITVKSYEYLGLSESELKNRCAERLSIYFKEMLEKKMTLVTHRNFNDDSIDVLAKVVIMSSDEYNELMRSRIQPPMNYQINPYNPYIMNEVKEVAKEILSEEISKAKTAEDYLTNRVRQLQNEHLLPKRRPT